MKMTYRVELRIPGKRKFGFYHLNNILIEVDIPDEYIVGYPNNGDIYYITPKGLAYLDNVLNEKLREESTVEIDEDSVEEGW